MRTPVDVGHDRAPSRHPMKTLKDETTMTTASTVLQANLKRVFNERDATRRRHAIEELYAADAVLYEQQGKYSGTEAIEGAITHLLGSLPPTLVFVLAAPVM